MITLVSIENYYMLLSFKGVNNFEFMHNKHISMIVYSAAI